MNVCSYIPALFCYSPSVCSLGSPFCGDVQVGSISLTLARTYRWRCDRSAELSLFAQALIRTHKSIGGGGLRLIGLREDSGSESFYVEEPLRSMSRLVTMAF